MLVPRPEDSLKQGEGAIGYAKIFFTRATIRVSPSLQPLFSGADGRVPYGDGGAGMDAKGWMWHIQVQTSSHIPK